MERYKPPRYTWSMNEEDLGKTFKQWGVVDWEITRQVMGSHLNSTNLTLEQRTVSVTWMREGHSTTLTLGDFESPADNLKALQLCVDDLRMIDRRGATDVMRAAFLQLEAPVQARDPYEVLGLRPDVGRQEVDAMFRVHANRTHPDKPGGDAEAFQEVTSAKERIYEARGWA